MRLTFGGVGGGDGVDDGLGLFVADFCGAGVFSMVRDATVVVVLVGSVVVVVVVLAWEAAWRGRLTLVVVDDIAEVVAAGVVRLSHAHRIVCEVDIAVVAKDWAARGERVALAWKTRRGREERGLTFWHFELVAVTSTTSRRAPRLIGILGIRGIALGVEERVTRLDLFKGSDVMARAKYRPRSRG